jgi:hypothetical protein
MSANAKQLEHPAFQVGPIGCEIRRGCHLPPWNSTFRIYAGSLGVQKIKKVPREDRHQMGEKPNRPPFLEG